MSLQLTTPTLRPREAVALRGLRARSPALEVFVTTLPLVLADVIGVSAAILAGAVVTGSLSLASPVFLTVPLLLLIVHLAFGMYPGTALDIVVEMRRLVIAASLAFAAYATSLGTIEAAPVLIASWIFACVLMPSVRSSARMTLSRTRWWGRTALVLGDAKDVGAVFASQAQLRSQGLLPIPSIHLDPRSAAGRRGPEWVVLCAPDAFNGEVSQWLVRRFPHILVVESRISESFGRLWLEPLQVGATTALHVKNRLRLRSHRMAKRAVDLGVCLATIPVLLPLALLVTGLIKCTSKGPVFYGHRRLGKDNRWFKAWKFRTMVVDADKALESYLAEHPELEAEWRETQKLRNDPRVTKIGSFLRKTSLDELPQLWNVLLGQMSLVGPRPIVADEVQRYGAAFDLYSQVVPGITGLWQVSGRNDTTYDERVALDCTYVSNWSVWLDFYILLRTVRTVIRGEGAC